jgi:hypothetical protein
VSRQPSRARSRHDPAAITGRAGVDSTVPDLGRLGAVRGDHARTARIAPRDTGPRRAVDEGYLLVRTSDDLLLVNIDAWGVIMICWGALLAAGGFGLTRAAGWARWFAVAVAFVDVLLQVGFLAAYPIWSAILILLDVVVIFALTARWSEARAAM